MARKFTTPFGGTPPTVAQQQLLAQALLRNKTRTHEYRRWSDRATIISHEASTDSYTIALTVGSNTIDSAQTFEGVRSVVPADVRRLDSGTVVAIGYLQERREQPIILGVGTVRQKVTDTITTPLSTIIQFSGGGLTLLHDRYDDNRQPGDPSTDQILGQDPTLLGAGGCTRHVHAVGGVGQITWTWSYAGADRIFEASGTNDFRLTFGVEGGDVGPGTAYPAGNYIYGCIGVLLTVIPPFGPHITAHQTVHASYLDTWPDPYSGPYPVPFPDTEDYAPNCTPTIVDPTAAECGAYWSASFGIGIAQDNLAIYTAASQHTTYTCSGVFTIGDCDNAIAAAVTPLFKSTPVAAYHCGSGGAPCGLADGTTLTATDAVGNVATAVISAS